MTALTTPSGFRDLADTVLSGPMEQASRENVRVKVEAFLGWWDANGRHPFTPELVLWYMGDLKNNGKSATYIGHCLSAVRKLARAAAMRRWIDSIALDGILSLKGPKIHATRIGQWLTEDEMLAAMAMPDRSTLMGRRDYVALGLMLYAGLRCTEAATVEVSHIQIRDGRPALVNLMGKGSKLRSIPIPEFLYHAMREWLTVAGVDSGPVLRSLKLGRVSPSRMDRLSAYNIVKKYLPKYTPHDMRRTFGRVARANGAELDQIQQSYGHAHMHTTQHYLGGTLNFVNAPCDALPIPEYTKES